MHHNPTILLIDDDIDDQEIFSLALERANDEVNCVFASDGTEALNKLTDDMFAPDYIFIDMNMPRMNGQQCLKEIKKIERLRNVPVYMYSTSADPATVAENKNLGAADFIVKPANINALSNILAGIVRNRILSIVLVIFCISMIPSNALAQKDTLSSVSHLKKLSFDELMNIVVTSVSKSPEKLTEVASAVQVITGEDIRRSTSMRLPEALRLASNTQVAQSGSHDWGITVRGFNGLPASNTSLADKLLVLIDGRTVYTPLFGGVFWDVQNVMLEDVDRIEVVSGPGGTLWSTNAVNGIINVISKPAKETQGVFASAAAGTFMQDAVSVRFGSHIDSAVYYRVYAQRFDYNNTKFTNGMDARDEWNMTQGGFRMDYIASPKSTLTFQGDLYSGDEDDTLSTLVNGQNIIGRWNHSISDRSGIMIQTYFDRTYRNIKRQQLTDVINTYDIELQHNLTFSRNHLVSGVGYRLSDDYITTPFKQYDPPHRDLQLFNLYIQDQFSIIPYKLELTAGTKVLHNDYSGFELQPSIRLAYTPSIKHTIWSAVSRTVRTPTRFDADIVYAHSFKAPDFKSEKVVAYEIGYRVRSKEGISVSLAAYYNQYSDLRSIDSTIVDTVGVYYFNNHLKANTAGAELIANFFVFDWWRIRTGYSYLAREFSITADSVYSRTDEFEAIDPKNQFMFQSLMNISKGFELDALVRYVDVLPVTIGTPVIPSYLTFNARVAWKHKWLTLSVNGQNLIHTSRYGHTEFGPKAIPQNIYGKINIDF